MIISIVLDAINTSVALVSTKNNLMCTVKGISDCYDNRFVVVHKKYFNQIQQFGKVEGRVRLTDDGLFLFEGFNWR
jgi:hypothetical protein